jgi:hypothetical protein
MKICKTWSVFATILFSSVAWWIYKRYFKCPIGFHTKINKDRPCLICSDKIF